MVLSIAGSGKIFPLARDCSGFSSITPLFLTYPGRIVVLLIRLSVFVETFLFFGSWEYKFEILRLNIRIRGRHEGFMLLPSFLTFLFVELVQFEL